MYAFLNFTKCWRRMFYWFLLYQHLISSAPEQGVKGFSTAGVYIIYFPQRLVVMGFPGEKLEVFFPLSTIFPSFAEGCSGGRRLPRPSGKP